MYEGEKKLAAKQAEHYELATKMATEIKSFMPDQQNEMVKHIFHIVKEGRLCQIKELEDNASVLRMTLENYDKL